MTNLHDPLGEPLDDTGRPVDEPRPASHGGPFAVGPVDPLVYRQSTDTPEKRAAAAYIPAASRRMELPLPAPVAPAPRTYSDWTPNATPDVPAPAAHLEQPADAPDTTTAGGRPRLLAAVIMTVPFALIAAVVWFGVTLLSGH